MSDNIVPIHDFMEWQVQGFRNHMAAHMASNFKEPCPVCEGRDFAATADGIPMRDDDNPEGLDDFISESIWFICRYCGSIFDTYELTINKIGQVQGKLELVTDQEFIANIHEDIGFKGGQQ